MTTSSGNLESLAAPETHLVSFVVRFVCDQPVAGPTQPATEWRGILRHVQSDAELHFTRWEEAVAFIAQHVRLDAQRDC